MPHKKGHSWGDLKKDISKKAGKVAGAFVRGKNKQNKVQLLINKYNPQSEHNKKIRKKEEIIKSDKSTRQEKSVAKTQKSAIKRKRDGVTIAEVHAKNKKAMQDRASKKNEDWKKMRRGDMSKEDFIKKYPRSNTAKKYGKK
tara:strand:+ start:56 stop:481 length:426 start_codon:yes stop_codon:yes gene_type:complete